MASQAYEYLMQGKFGEAITWQISNTLPLGLVWIFIGTIVFGSILYKTKSYAISGIVFILYLVLLMPFNLVDTAVQPFLGMLIAAMLAVLIIRVFIK